MSVQLGRRIIFFPFHFPLVKIIFFRLNLYHSFLISFLKNDILILVTIQNFKNINFILIKIFIIT